MSVLNDDLRYIANQIKGYENSTFLITGATGFIGSILTKSLIEYNEKGGNVKILVFVRNYEKAKEFFGDGVEILVGDITDKINYDGKVDYVVHLASQTKSKEFILNPELTYDTAVNGTKNLLKFSKEKGAKFLYASSMEAYGEIFSNELITEDVLGFVDETNKRSCYPLGKRKCEQMVKEYANDGFAVIARFSQVFGAGAPKEDNRLPITLARAVVTRSDINLNTDGSSVGNYVYSVDAITAIFCLLEKGINGEIYNVVNQNLTRTVLETAKTVAEKVSGKIKVNVNVNADKNYGYAPKTLLKLSGKKLENLGWTATTDLVEGYEKMAQDVKERL